MKRLLLAPVLSLAALATTACDGAAAFRRAVPQKETVALRVPGGDSGGKLTQALTLGEQAPLYGQTVAIATSVNGGVLWVFDVIDHILALPPTTVDENVAVWGPSEPRGLERISYRFTVERVEEGHFTYHLDARKKGETSEDAFIEVFNGEAFPGDDDDGTGTLNYHLGSILSLDDNSCLTGEINVAYDASSEPRALDVHFEQVANLCNDEELKDADYLYLENDDKSGQMDFAVRANVHKAEENKPAEEVLSVRSRWTTGGAGRSDVQVSEGEIPADLATYIPGTSATTVDVVECWDDAFALVYADTTPDELEPHLDHPQTGDAAACAFADASFAGLD
jgi:hypothetical protein